MQLLNFCTLNVLITTLVVTGAISSLSALTGWGWRSLSKRFLLLFLSLFAFAMLGFVTGLIMADSRESAVGAVVPGVLTLLGALAAYIVGSKGIKQQTEISAIVLCFGFSLLVGTIFGIELRTTFEAYIASPAILKARGLALEENQLAVETQRLQDYIQFLQLKSRYSEENKLDLSRFESSFEKRSSEKGDVKTAKPEPTPQPPVTWQLGKM